MDKLIIFLIRKKFGLKKYEMFRFANQKQQGIYWFDKTALLKSIYNDRFVKRSNVSLNWLLSKECRIIKL